MILYYVPGSYILKKLGQLLYTGYVLEVQGEPPLYRHPAGMNSTATTDPFGGMRMFKKSAIAVLLSVILAVMLGTSAFAAEESMSPAIAEALAGIEEVNTEIYAEIALTQAEVEALYEAYRSAYAQEEDAEKRSALTLAYNEEANLLIHALDMKTREMTRVGVEEATAAGVNVQIVWIPVLFADRVALIDPIRVIDW